MKKLKDIPLEEFDYLKDNGIDIVQMKGVWKLGEYGLKFDKKLYYSRCAMAHLILNDVFGKTWDEELKAWGYTKPDNEFWEYAFKEVKAKYPKSILLAEVYEEWEIELLYKLSFTYTYDKALLDQLEGSLFDVNNYIHYKTEENFWGYSALFVENHDENRAVYNMGNIGQWCVYRNKLDVHLRKTADE